ncbi:MAG: hypothetical protein ACJ78I_01080 [Gemmatimonadaceae bacterium]
MAVKEEVGEAVSLLHDFAAQQHANVFMRAFSFPASQLPAAAEKEVELADRVMLIDDIAFIFALREREQRVASKVGDLEKWISNQVSRKGVKQIQNTRELLARYVGLSLVNHFGHRVLASPGDPESMIGIIIYRVHAKSHAFRAARFKRNTHGNFVHILRDVEYFEICQHFATPAELFHYLSFRRDILLSWDAPSAGVTESALIGQYLEEDYSSPPDQRFEKSARSRVGAAACELSFVLDSLAAKIASQDVDEAEDERDGDQERADDCYEILSELAMLSGHELRAFRQEIRLALESVRSDRFELPYRIVSHRTGCGFLIVPLTSEFHERAYGALKSLSIASKHELDLDRQVGIGMWKNSEFVDIEWIFLAGENPPDPKLDERLATSYPFRVSSERWLPPIFR